MKWRKSEYQRGWVGLADLAVALFWISLWMVGPGNGRDVERRLPSGTVTAYARIRAGDVPAFRQPDLFILPPDAGHESAREAGAPDELMETYARAPRFMEREARDACAPGFAAAPLPLPPMWLTNAFSPRWDESGVLAVQAATNMEVVVQLGAELARNGYQMADVQIPSSAKNGKSWMVVARVEVGPDGRVENVYIETGSDDARVNAAVLRALYKGAVARPGSACKGRAVVNYGTK